MSWNSRIDAHNYNGIETFDSIAATAATYGGTATWPGTCNTVNWAAIIAFKRSSGTPAYVQGNNKASTYVGGGFNTYTIAFTSNNTLHNCIIVAVAFNTAIALSGITLTDSNSNTYKAIFGGHVPGSSDFIMCFIAVNVAAGANTITLTQVVGQSDMQAVSVAIHEYSGILNTLPSGTPPLNYGYSYTDTTGCVDSISYAGIVHLNTVPLSIVTSGTNDLLFLITASLPYCAGVTASGGGGGGGGVITLACPSSTAYLRLFYSSSFIVTNGTSPYTFSIISGSLPPGLILNTSTGLVSGTPIQAGIFPYTAQVVDSSSLMTTCSCSIRVSASLNPVSCS